MHVISTRQSIPLLASTIVSALYSAFLFTPSLASAHAIAGDRVFPSTMAVDDPGVGDEANLQFGHRSRPRR